MTIQHTRPFVVQKTPDHGMDACFPCAEQGISTDATHSLITPQEAWKITGLCPRHASEYRSARHYDEDEVQRKLYNRQRNYPQLSYVHKVVRKLPDGRRFSPCIHPELDPTLVVEYGPSHTATPTLEGHWLFSFPFGSYPSAMGYVEWLMDYRVREEGEEFELWDAHAEIVERGTILVPAPHRAPHGLPADSMGALSTAFWQARHEAQVQGTDPDAFFTDEGASLPRESMNVTLCSSITLLAKRY